MPPDPPASQLPVPAGPWFTWHGDRCTLPDGTPLAVAAARTLQAACPRCVAVLRPEQTGLAECLTREGLAVVAVFMFVARPAAVFLCALPDRKARWTWQEMLFMCWTRETGVIPGALAGLLMGMGAPEAPLIASVTFIAILVTILLQATTTKWLAGRLGLLE